MAHELRLGLGGHPITNDDAVLLQDNTFEGLSDIVSGLLPSGTTRAILYGCNITTSGGSTSITAGAIYYNGIIYRVEAQSITTVPSLYFVIEEIVGAFDPVIYADTTPRNVHFTLKMKMQAGSGVFLISDIDRIAENFQTLLDLTAYATVSYVDTLFATLRNGYDPTFRINPTTGVLEWSYASPSHPIPSGGVGNPWRSLGIVIGAVTLGTFGIFEVEINTQRSLPVGYFTTPISAEAGLPNYTTVYDIVQFDIEISDFGDNFSLFRRYVAPIDSVYDFVIEDTKVQCITAVVPNTSVVAGHYVTLNFGIFKNGVLIPGTQWGTNLNAGGNTTGANPMVVGTVTLPSQNLNISLLANDEITIRHWLNGTSLNPTDPNRGTKQGQLAANARAAYRLSGMNFYNI